MLTLTYHFSGVWSEAAAMAGWLLLYIVVQQSVATVVSLHAYKAD